MCRIAFLATVATACGHDDEYFEGWREGIERGGYFGELNGGACDDIGYQFHLDFELSLGHYPSDPCPQLDAYLDGFADGFADAYVPAWSKAWDDAGC